MTTEFLTTFLKEISSFNPPELFSLTSIFFWLLYAIFLTAAAVFHTKKPGFSILLFALSLFIYCNDFLRGIISFDPQSPLIFTKFFFWGFFALVLAADSVLYTKKPLRSLFLFIVSVFFYYKTSGLFFFMLLFTIHMDYFIGKIVHKSSDETLRKILVGISVTVNLGILIYFKYAYFFTESYNSLFDGDFKVINQLAVFGNDVTGKDWFRVDKIILPVGISFYTFQTISYTVDLYKRRLEPAKSLIDFGFFVSFFPQLVAGPIVRASDFIPQIYAPYSLSRVQFGTAIFWILNGLTKKLFIGDYIAVNFIDRVYANPTMYTGVENFLAVMAYSLQVYCDFSGYTDIAIGVSLLMGFTLTRNFNSPYKAQDVQDFWRRWHISLSTWLRDYLYIPLGGNKKASAGTFLWLVIIGLLIFLLTKTYFTKDFSAGGDLKAGDIIIFGCMAILALFAPLAILLYTMGLGGKATKLRNTVTTEINMMLTMLIGGLWHGASWLFIIWGGLNGLGLVFFKRWKKISPLTNINNVFTRSWGIVATFVFISFTRIFFRSPDLLTAKEVINQMAYNFRLDLLPDILVAYKYVFIITAIGMLIHWIPESFKEKYRNGFSNLPLPLMALFTAVVVFVVFQAVTGELQAFIYFQF